MIVKMKTLILFLGVYHAVVAYPSSSRILKFNPAEYESFAEGEDLPALTDSEKDSDIDILTTGQIVLNGFQNIIANAPEPDELPKYVQGFVTELKHVGIRNKNELSNLGFEYIKALKERGYALAEKNQKLMMSAFSLIGHIFLSEEYRPTRRNATRKALTLNIINDKSHINQIVQAIKEGLASSKSEHGTNVNQNLNLNINIYTLLNVGKKLKQEKII